MQATASVRDIVLHDLASCERIASGGFNAVIWPACGDDDGLRAEIAQLGSNRARALLLFLHNKPTDDLSLAFRRAEALYDCGARKPGGKTWKLYRLKQFSRDWTPGRKLEAAIEEIVEQELERQKEPKRRIKVELFTRPSHPGAGPDDLCHTVILNIAASAETEEDWQEDELASRRRTPNRKIILCITPTSKGFDCGWHDTNAAMANNVMLAVAQRLLGQKDAPEPIVPIAINLSSLSNRPRFWASAPEHRIHSVQVKKLVVSSGPGTRTYFVSARSKADAYDVAPRNLTGARIIAASLRVVFERGAYGAGQKIVNFDLAVPNRCSLRETEDAERYILQPCLFEWGVIDPETDDDRPLRIAPAPSLLSDVLSIDVTGISKRHAEGLFGHGLEPLLQLGALARISPGDVTLCDLCGVPHPADVRPDGLNWMVHCPEAGIARVSLDDLPAFTSNFDALAIGLAAALPIKFDRIQKLPDESLIYLGRGTGRTEWSALFAPDFNSPFAIDRVTERLRGNPSLAPGILICSADAPKQIPLPGKHVAVSIDELFRIEGGRLGYNEVRLAQALNRSTPPKAAGRPSLNALAARLAAARRRMKLQASSSDAELNAIKDMIFMVCGEVRLPSDKVIRYEWLKDHFARVSFPETQG